MFDINNEMSSVALKIDKLFESFFSAGIPSQNLQEAMRYATIGGGKKFRPYLIYTIAQKLGVKDDTALYVGACIEMLHAYTLIHDDLPCMDDDDTRRGIPSTHIKFNEFTAVLTGDALQTEAFRLLSSNNLELDPQVKLQVINQVAETVGAKNLISGQMFDLEKAKGMEADNISFQLIHMLKTAKLISLCTHIAAILANGDENFQNKLAEYGENLGLMYQIVDDIKDNDGIVSVWGRDKALNKLKELDSSSRHLLKELKLEDLTYINEFIVAESYEIH
ncbi:MAG: polyprenyl synthetase family protein [Alphaproteobacteria bacterium]|jgi:farnesyl diphosphate synthase|nr:polyprenyl synthetase family protein [Alphaproteobacteria bacterium]